jgi:hypothetical protein
MMTQKTWEEFEETTSVSEFLKLLDMQTRPREDLSLTKKDFCRFVTDIFLQKPDVTVRDFENLLIKTYSIREQDFTLEDEIEFLTYAFSRLEGTAREILHDFYNNHDRERFNELAREFFGIFITLSDYEKYKVLLSFENSKEDFLKLARQSPKRMLLEILQPLSVAEKLRKNLSKTLITDRPELLEFVSPPELETRGVENFLTSNTEEYFFLCKSASQRSLEALLLVKKFDVPLAIKLFLNRSYLGLSECVAPLVAYGKVSETDVIQFVSDISTSATAYREQLDYFDRLALGRAMSGEVEVLFQKHPELIALSPSEGRDRLIHVVLAVNGEFLDKVYLSGQNIDETQDVIYLCESIAEYESLVKLALNASGLKISEFIRDLTVPIAEAIIETAHKKY